MRIKNIIFKFTPVVSAKDPAAKNMMIMIVVEM